MAKGEFGDVGERREFAHWSTNQKQYHKQFAAVGTEHTSNDPRASRILGNCTRSAVQVCSRANASVMNAASAICFPGQSNGQRSLPTSGRHHCVLLITRAAARRARW